MARPCSDSAARRSGPGPTPSQRHVVPSPPGPPPIRCLLVAPLKKGAAPVAAHFSRTPASFPLQPRHRQNPLPSVSCRRTPPPPGYRRSPEQPLHRNTTVPSRPRHPIVTPPPWCIPVSPAMPVTSPSSCVSCLRRFPCASSPSWMPPVAPARRRVCGHRTPAGLSGCLAMR
jgi:hypothetical protein